MVAAAVVGAAVVGGVVSSQAQKSAANKAAGAQERAAQAGIDQQNYQFERVRELLSPYSDAGMNALGQQQNLIGLNGNQAQQDAIYNLQNGAQYQSMLKAGNDSILANASATGGLRGGNTQAALAQFSPQLLAQTINDQYSKLGGITSLGQNAAAGVGNAGMQTGNNISQLLQQQGSAQAGAYLAQGKATAGMVNSVTGAIGGIYGYGGGF